MINRFIAMPVVAIAAVSGLPVMRARQRWAAPIGCHVESQRAGIAHLQRIGGEQTAASAAETVTETSAVLCASPALSVTH